MSSTKSTPSRLAVKWTALISTLMIADWLFLEQPAGFASGVFLSAFTILLCIVSPQLLAKQSGKIMLAGLLGLCVALIIEPTLLAVTLYFLGLCAFVSLPKRHAPENALSVLMDSARLLLSSFTQFFYDRRTIKKTLQRRPLSRTSRLALLRLFVLPLVFSLIFLVFFAEANPVIAAFIRSFDFSGVAIFVFLYKIFYIQLPFLFLLGLLVWVVLRPRFKLTPEVISTPPNLDLWINKTSLVLSLVVFNLIFAVQNGLDISFILGNTSLMPAGLTFAQYAHYGAYPLILTVLMATAYVLTVFSDHQQKLRTKAADWLVYLWLLQNVFLVCAAADRLLNYIDAYSLTYLRLATLIWMGLIAVGLLLTLMRLILKKKNSWLINSNMVVLVGVLYACCFIPFGTLIAAYNLHRAQIQGVQVDMEYISKIGTEAIPALRYAASNSMDKSNKQIYATVLKQLETDLRQDLDQNWRSWTLRRASINTHIMSRE